MYSPSCNIEEIRKLPLKPRCPKENHAAFNKPGSPSEMKTADQSPTNLLSYSLNNTLKTLDLIWARN